MIRAIRIAVATMATMCAPCAAVIAIGEHDWRWLAVAVAVALAALAFVLWRRPAWLTRHSRRGLPASALHTSIWRTDMDREQPPKEWLALIERIHSVMSKYGIDHRKDLEFWSDAAWALGYELTFTAHPIENWEKVDG